ncbi:MAG: ferritin family protein [Candidatus Aminicenantes bacterium]|nr:ferritin family protein [Candidatus Aminicenantes bacterium]
MFDISTASDEELLGIAVKAEMDANKAYTDLASLVSNPLLKEKFQWLAFEENKHREVLEKLYADLNPGEEIQVPDKVDEDLLPSIHMSPSSPLVDILYQTMESEKSAENFYANLSKRFEDPQKKILEYLSKVEHSHYIMLESEYTLALDFEDYAEKDIDKVIT